MVDSLIEPSWPCLYLEFFLPFTPLNWKSVNENQDHTPSTYPTVVPRKRALQTLQCCSWFLVPTPASPWLVYSCSGAGSLPRLLDCYPTLVYFSFPLEFATTDWTSLGSFTSLDWAFPSVWSNVVFVLSYYFPLNLSPTGGHLQTGRLMGVCCYAAYFIIYFIVCKCLTGFAISFLDLYSG